MDYCFLTKNDNEKLVQGEVGRTTSIFTSLTALLRNFCLYDSICNWFSRKLKSRTL